MENSRPYNPDLANTFFRAGYIEAWGRGIQKICEECNLIGAKVPEFNIVGDDITIKFTAATASKKNNRTNDNRKEKGVNAKVLELITAQTDISLSEIADRLGVSYKTVQRAIADLKENSVIERIGGRKKGYWRIKDKEQVDTGGKVLELITTQTDISLSEMADRLGVSYKTVQRAVADLKKNGVIERIGGRKTGYWRIKGKEQVDTGGKQQ